MGVERASADVRPVYNVLDGDGGIALLLQELYESLENSFSGLRLTAVHMTGNGCMVLHFSLLLARGCVILGMHMEKLMEILNLVYVTEHSVHYLYA